ncbi:MAG TPA: histidine triad nucleotide-binding protein [Candidatus Dormibacteraeota bacterium]|nr:histidine triad nucleotide-binding protein [Candidatus Dormibacteraeota bacterium]
MECLFCKIVAGEIPADEIYRDDDAIAIADVNPQAPKHVLVLPRKHYATVADILDGGDEALLGHVVAVATKLARDFGSRGFRLVVNTGVEGGQTVDHVHVHVLAGRHMSWPPG